MAQLPADLAKVKKEVEGIAREYGLDFFDVIFEVLDWDELNMVAAYGGFPNRYPHWRFGMEYEKLSKSYTYGLSKIYEMVINNDPCYAYLLHSNHMVDQKMVMAHVYGHCDFFKNNVFFGHTHRKMMDEMANHKSRVQRMMDRLGIEVVENFIDACLSLENLIDTHSVFHKKTFRESAEEPPTIHKMKSKQYMDKYINPEEILEEQQKALATKQQEVRKFPENPEKDILTFLLECAPLEDWQRDILSIIREEAYYFAPQGQTKIMNEGWACVTGNTLVFTDRGLVPMEELVEDCVPVCVNDGKNSCPAIDFARFENRKTVRMTTRRGLEIEGSLTHQILLKDGQTWKRLGTIKPGDCVAVGPETELWPQNYVSLDWRVLRRTTLEDVAEQSGVHLSTVIRHKDGSFISHSAGRIENALTNYEVEHSVLSFCQNKRASIRVPCLLDEKLGAFLGYLVGDGHISKVKRQAGLTTGDEQQALAFSDLTRELFHLEAKIKKDGNRFRVLFSSQHLNDFMEALGLTTGPSARRKSVPKIVLRSPKTVVAAFLRALFDCDGYAGPCGVILSTSSTEMSQQVQLLLLNFGILSSRRRQPKDIWHVHVMGASAKMFMEEIGFGLARKQRRLERYVQHRRWFKRESWTDVVVSVEQKVADVYDITVDETHRYVAHGFINHNSFWHSKMMTEKLLKASEVIDYADHHSGTVSTQPGQLNPYKLGIELFRDIEDRWNKGRFGKEYNECDNMVMKKQWDQKLGLGRQKIFEVRKIYNDVNFIDEFLTPEFCAEHRMFVFAYNVSADQYEIVSREFQKIKKQLLFQLTNFGNPFIYAVDANYKNRGELMLKHQHEGVDLRNDWAKETLKALYLVWKRPVHVDTMLEGVPKILSFDGTEYHEIRP